MPPLNSVSGTLGKTDRTIGRDRSLAMRIQKEGTGLRMQNKPQMNKSGSPARHARSCDYKECDIKYKALDTHKRICIKVLVNVHPAFHRGKPTYFKKWSKTCEMLKRDYVKSYYEAAWNIPYTRHTNYNIFMKLCLLKVRELQAFTDFSYFSRYLVLNDTLEHWHNKVIKLTDLQVLREDGRDCQVFRLDGYLHIITEIPHRIETKGDCLVLIEDLASWDAFTIDVYSYGKVAFPEDPSLHFEYTETPITNASWINSAAPDSNYGGEGTLEITHQERPWDTLQRWSFIEIPEGLGGILRLFVSHTYYFQSLINIYRCGAFEQTTVTWNNMPAMGEFLLTFNAHGDGWHEIPIPQGINYIALTPEGDPVYAIFFSPRAGESISPKMNIVLQRKTFNKLWEKKIGSRFI